MGTTFKIIMFAESDSLAQFAVDSVFSHIAALNNIMSDYLPESELNALNKTYDEWVPVSDDLWNVFAKKIAFYLVFLN